MIADTDIVVMLEQIWEQTVGLPLVLTQTAPSGDSGPSTLDGIVNITGGWQGTVILQMPRPLARCIAGRMFGVGEEAASPEDLQDVLGELANQAGGNIKALLPMTCHLSLPAVVEGHNYTVRVPGSRVVNRLAFRCGEWPVVLSVTSAAAA